jgi:hypothetical protein
MCLGFRWDLEAKASHVLPNKLEANRSLQIPVVTAMVHRSLRYGGAPASQMLG